MNKEKSCITINCGCCDEGNIAGAAPTIGENGNWFIHEDDTGVKAQGEDGKSAYEVAVEVGFIGTPEEWLESLKGAAGETGVKGEKGNPGDIGPTGPSGPQGVQGPTGAQGIKGDKGDTGALGIAGSIGTADILFSGEANTIGSTYTLSNNITDYKIIIVEFGGKYGRSFEWIFSPKTGLNFRGAYGLIAEMVWIFPSANSMSIVEKHHGPEMTDCWIFNIYGIR